MPRPQALVIEDQINLVTLYEDALRLVGYDVHSIQDGLRALNYLETSETLPNIIILDVNLPSLSGYDLHTHIRKREKYAQVPVLILTANSLMAERIRPNITENDHLYIKPVSISQLQALAKGLRPDSSAEGKAEHQTATHPIPPMNGDNTDDAEASDAPTPVAETDVLHPDDTRIEDNATKGNAQAAEAMVENTVLQPDDTVTASSTVAGASTDKPRTDDTVLSPEDE